MNTPQTFRQFGGLRLDLPVDEVGHSEAVALRDVDWNGSLRHVRSRDGFQKLKAAEATGDYKGLFPHSTTRMLVVKRVSGGEVKLVAIDRDCVEKTTATWNSTVARSTFSRFGTPSGSYTYCRPNVAAAKVVRFDGTTFTEPTATVDGVAAKEMPRGAFMATWPAGGNRLVVAGTAATGGPNGAASSASHVWFSDPGNAESWHTVAPEANYVQLSPGDGEEITAMTVFGGMVYVFKETKFFVFYGVGVDNEGGPEFSFREVGLGEGSRMKRPALAAVEETSDQLACAAPSGVYFATSDGIWVTTGGEPVKISQALRALEEAAPFEGPMADVLNGSTEAFRWPATGIAAIGHRLFVKRYEFMFFYDIPTGAWGCWRMPSVALAVWTGLTAASGAETASAYTAGEVTESGGGGERTKWAGLPNAKGAPDGKYATTLELGVSGKTESEQIGMPHAFAIPASAIIQGIQVTVWGYAPFGGAKDSIVRVKFGGGEVNRSKGEAWPASPTSRTYGGAEDLWGVPWTAANVNAGITVYFAAAAIVGSGQMAVDASQVAVFYTLPEATSGVRPRLFCTSGKFVYFTAPGAAEQANSREPFWQCGGYDLGTDDAKTLTIAKLTGEGAVEVSSSADFGPLEQPTVFDLGTGTVGIRQDNIDQTATIFSHRFAGDGPWSLQRFTRYLRETETPGNMP